MGKRLGFIAVVLSFALLTTPLNAASPKAGASCSKLGATSTYAGKKYTCIKSGSKLVWNKGVVVTQAAPKPSATPVATPESKPTPTPSPTVTPSPIKIEVSDTSRYLPAKNCKLINGNTNTDSNQSHDPRTWKLVDVTKTIRILIFSVEFPDLLSTSRNAPSFDDLITQFEKYYENQSDGKMKFKWTIAPQFALMSKTVASYGVGERAAGSVWQLNYDIQDLAWKNYNKKDFDFIIGSAPTTTQRSHIASSPAFGTRDGQSLPGTYLGGDYWSNRTPWDIPAHEFGHSALGVADLYDFDASMLGEKGFALQFQYMGIFDIMNWAGGDGIGMTFWNRWVTSLIGDDQLLCLPESQTISRLTPLGKSGAGTKGLVIKLSDKSALVMENRQPVGSDVAISSSASGVIVYLVDTTKESGHGPMRIIRKDKSTDVWFRDNGLHLNESIKSSGYVIKVVGVEGSDYLVEVKKE